MSQVGLQYIGENKLWKIVFFIFLIIEMYFFFATCKKAYIIQTSLSLSIYNNEITIILEVIVKYFSRKAIEIIVPFILMESCSTYQRLITFD